ncbi:hypothetical protein [Mediterraneibacter gnavus]|uniref:hypothetical protein n=1 Tax=Mediterraneibacter gnavus TaxID=33038 RepID=UPI00356815DB
MKMNYSDMFDCISDKSAEILNEYEEYELDTVFSAVNTEKVVISKMQILLERYAYSEIGGTFILI